MCRSPQLKVHASGGGKALVKFDTYDTAEGQFCCQQHGTALAGTDVEKGRSLHRVQSYGLPTQQQFLEQGRSHAMVRRDVAVVTVTGGKLLARNE